MPIGEERLGLRQLAPVPGLLRGFEQLDIERLCFHEIAAELRGLRRAV